MAANVDQQYAAVIENPENDAVRIRNRKRIILTENAFQSMCSQPVIKGILSEHFESLFELAAICFTQAVSVLVEGPLKGLVL